MTATFSATIANWANESKDKLDLIVREATEDTVEQIGKTRASGGPMPVDTGFLRNSMAADINGNGNFATVKPTTKGDKGDGTGAAEHLTSGMKAGDIVNVAWTAVYAARVNYGFVGEDSLGRNYANAGAGFLESGAARWPHFVDEAAKRNAQ